MMENLDQSVSVGENSQGSRKKLRQKTKRELDYEKRQVVYMFVCFYISYFCGYNPKLN